MRNHQPTYQIHEGCAGFFWLLRIVGNHVELIERFEDRQSAEEFMDFLAYVHIAPRRLATH
jgi:hypothetical protein